ncbi:DMT family transporter [Larkinella terrae]|uniref:EamA family transporter n=1 Tax=Larkinella terrae TaxID=2025311 RepID=A0A7K0ETW8_9BACT|nr:EamA family transporter [Larkinella terrae]MRS64878.1 EamA family transporter [Larkinella terrae]
MKSLLPGLLFAALWASASAATKFGVLSADPLVLANTRFLIAGPLMLAVAHGIQRGPLPNRTEFKRLTLFALLNTTIYLGAFVLAIRQVSAGIGSLSTATSPLFITLLSAIWLKRPVRWYEFAGIFIGMLGVLVATYPLLQNSFATVPGLLILLGGMISVSLATVYYTRFRWKLPNLVINGWQVLIGGFLLLPFTFLFGNFEQSHFDTRFWGSVFWLIIPVSVISLQIWFYLVRQDAVKASLWLFLCPIFGFTYSSILLDEPLSVYTFLGTALVLVGLYLGQRDKFKRKP